MASSKKTKKTAKKTASRRPPVVIDRAARDALTLVGHALGGLHGLESEAQGRVDAAVAACTQLKA